MNRAFQNEQDWFLNQSCALAFVYDLNVLSPHGNFLPWWVSLNNKIFTNTARVNSSISLFKSLLIGTEYIRESTSAN